MTQETARITASGPDGDAPAGNSGRPFVTAAAGDAVSVVMATPDECRAFGLPLWSAKLLWSITHADGTTTVCPADDVRVVVGPAPGRGA